jgi:hypothetical protein
MAGLTDALVKVITAAQTAQAAAVKRAHDAYATSPQPQTGQQK